MTHEQKPESRVEETERLAPLDSLWTAFVDAWDRERTGGDPMETVKAALRYAEVDPVIIAAVHRRERP